MKQLITSEFETASCVSQMSERKKVFFNVVLF